MSPHSCSKISLVKAYLAGQKEKAIKMYVVIDEQSNRSLAKSEVFSRFNIRTRPAPYTLKTCSGKAHVSGRRASSSSPWMERSTFSFNRMGLCSSQMIDLKYPLLRLCNITHIYSQMRTKSKLLTTTLLFFYSILRVHKVCEQINGSNNASYAQRLDLGWD